MPLLQTNVCIKIPVDLILDYNLVITENCHDGIPHLFFPSRTIKGLSMGPVGRWFEVFVSPGSSLSQPKNAIHTKLFLASI